MEQFYDQRYFSRQRQAGEFGGRVESYKFSGFCPWPPMSWLISVVVADIF